MPHMIANLEAGLQMWERLWFSLDSLCAMNESQHTEPFLPRSGIRRNYREFRRYLLGQTDLTPQDFAVPDDLPASFGPIMGHLHFHMLIDSWNRASRRCYTLPEDLQFMLEHTTLRGLRWEEVRLPFDSYVVQLARGVVVDGVQLNTVHVTTGPDGEGGSYFFVHLIGTDAGRCSPLTQDERDRMLRRIRSRRYGDAEEAALANLTAGRNGLRICSSFHRFDGLVEEGLDPESDQINVIGGPQARQSLTSLNIAMRVVIGLNLYLRSLTPGSRQQAEWQPVRFGTQDPRAVASPTQVCEVQSIITLSDEERRWLREGRTGLELCCHFREGHWRRPPGLGHDPAAERTVWVRPTLVRQDRLRRGEVAGGCNKVV